MQDHCVHLHAVYHRLRNALGSHRCHAHKVSFPLSVHGRVNRFGLPFIEDILLVTKCLYKSSHIGYINSDILFAANLFDVIRAIPKARPALFPIVGLVLLCECSMSWR